MQLTWQGFVVLGIIAYVALSSVLHGRAERTDVAALAALGPCGVATAYSEWRVAFETALDHEDAIDGAALRSFRSRSGAFERAARAIRHELVDRLPGAERGMLDALIAMTGNDAARSAPLRSPETFVDRWFDACPVQAHALLGQ